MADPVPSLPHTSASLRHSPWYPWAMHPPHLHDGTDVMVFYTLIGLSSYASEFIMNVRKNDTLTRHRNSWMRIYMAVCLASLIYWNSLFGFYQKFKSSLSATNRIARVRVSPSKIILFWMIWRVFSSNFVAKF